LVDELATEKFQTQLASARPPNPHPKEDGNGHAGAIKKKALPGPDFTVSLVQYLKVNDQQRHKNPNKNQPKIGRSAEKIGILAIALTVAVTHLKPGTSDPAENGWENYQKTINYGGFFVRSAEDFAAGSR
jgi:hypothetical protein